MALLAPLRLFTIQLFSNPRWPPLCLFTISIPRWPRCGPVRARIGKPWQVNALNVKLPFEHFCLLPSGLVRPMGLSDIGFERHVEAQVDRARKGKPRHYGPVVIFFNLYARTLILISSLLAHLQFHMHVSSYT